MNDSVLIIFAKAPIHGETKTRLIPRIGNKGAAELHKSLVLHTLKTATQAQLCPIELWCTPSADHAFFQGCVQQFDITLHTQQGIDLGQRMAHAIDTALRHKRHVILIGTDCPSLTVNILQQVMSVLHDGNDAVIVPAIDGGYVLIGVTRSSPALFDSIAWGTDSVLQTTRDRLKNLGWKWQELPEHQDIDRPQDLDQLLRIPSFQELSKALDNST